ncbi:metallophosphoesterase [uncultured Robinsoniella sp.]|uniref:metallophosphoesterase n=1 Tax=uncultured Robinsoniella sp. TaxID=904190 RepID=UPI00374E74CD
MEKEKIGLSYRTIVFISDLHFDFTNQEFNPEAADRLKEEFLSFIKENYGNCLVCLAGDYFNDYRKTLDFIKELEKNKIRGFCVLGNHDYWSEGQKSYQELIALFDTETKENQYFRLLITGRKYYDDDLCVIGDTGWTSFRRRVGGDIPLEQFMELPDASKVKGFLPEQIKEFHGNWIAFANEVVSTEEKVLILTHFPMFDFTREDSDCWWSSVTGLKAENSWNIFGHTHHKQIHCYNNVSYQIGYANKSAEQVTGVSRYSFELFGRMERISGSSGIALAKESMLSAFFSPITVTDTIRDIAVATQIKSRGFKRCAANKKNFAALANDRSSYLKQVMEILNGCLEGNYCDYVVTERLSKYIVESVFASIAVLEENDFSDIRAFVTAAVITGYVYNNVPHMIEDMRPLDDYDVIRFWLMFLTIKKYNIGMTDIHSVRKDMSNYIAFQNVDIYLPAVNNMVMPAEEVLQLMQKNNLGTNGFYVDNILAIT